MTEHIPQTYDTHRRFDPWYHFVGFGLLLAAFALAVVQIFRQPGATTVWELLVSVGLLITFLRVRIYALRNQDRLIRLEETLRLERILSEPLQARIRELTPGQFVALRFASDHELVSLVEQTLAEKLEGEAIKKRIVTWRPDTFRV
jgi:hypothetical protein